MTGKVVGADDAKTNGSLRGARRKRERKITGEEALRILREQSEKEAAALAEEDAEHEVLAVEIATMLDKFEKLEARKLKRVQAARRAAIKRVETMEMQGAVLNGSSNDPAQEYLVRMPASRLKAVKAIAKEQGISIQRVLRIGVELAVEYYGARA